MRLRLFFVSLFIPGIAFATSTGTSRVEARAVDVWSQTVFSDAGVTSDGAPLVVSHDSIQTVLGQTDVAIRVRTLSDWDPGQVRASANVDLTGLRYTPCTNCFPDGAGTLRGSALAITSTYADDYVIPGTGTFTTNITLDLSGQVTRIFDWINGTTLLAYQNGTIDDASVFFDFTVTQRQPGNCEGTPCTVNRGLAGGRVEVTSRYDGTTGLTSFGFANAPSGWSNGLHSLTSTDFDVLLGVPYAVYMEVGVTVPEQYSHGGGDRVLAALDFAHTFGLTTNGPVFALADGMTAIAPSVGLFGNQFTPVPEPGTAVALALGLAAIAVRRIVQ
jgi:hypothetical protein